MTKDQAIDLAQYINGIVRFFSVIACWVVVKNGEVFYSLHDIPRCEWTIDFIVACDPLGLLGDDNE